MDYIENNTFVNLLLLVIMISSIYGAVALVFYFYIKSEKKKAKQEKVNNIKEKATAIINSHQKVEPSDDGILAASSIIIGVISLEFYAKQISPKYIVGVNRGGWLLSTYLAQRLEIDRNHLLRFNSDNAGELLDDVNSINKTDSILLIDDISRTGDSLEVANDYLKIRFPDNNISVAVLAVCAENKMKKKNQITCYPYYTNTPDIALPWSSEERKKLARERNFQAGRKSISIGDESVLDAKSPIIKMSDKNNGEGIDIVAEDADLIMKFIAAVTT
jgi:hypoxanthine phosphoribosyltransferase